MPTDGCQWALFFILQLQTPMTIKNKLHDNKRMNTIQSPLIFNEYLFQFIERTENGSIN